MYVFCILQGAVFEIFGPVLPELIIQTATNYDGMLRAVAMRGAGHLVGGIVGVYCLPSCKYSKRRNNV